MEKTTFNKFRQLIYEKSGITLSQGKEALVTARVAKRMRKLSMEDYRAYLQYVMDDASGKELVHLIDAISTNVTSFYREAEHFEFLSNALTEWYAKGQRKFRIWSAASSTGEEPYTIGITVLEALGTANVDSKILATDISTRVLERCMQGRYDEEKVEPVPKNLRNKYFDKVKGEDGICYVVRPNLKELFLFRRLNLSEPPFPMQGPLDVVFCRNVMIYFDNYVRANLLGEIQRLLRPGGYLMVGHAESLTGMMSALKTVRPSIYVKT